VQVPGTNWPINFWVLSPSAIISIPISDVALHVLKWGVLNFRIIFCRSLSLRIKTVRKPKNRTLSKCGELRNRE